MSPTEIERSADMRNRTAAHSSGWFLALKRKPRSHGSFFVFFCFFCFFHTHLPNLVCHSASRFLRTPRRRASRLGRVFAAPRERRSRCSGETVRDRWLGKLQTTRPTPFPAEAGKGGKAERRHKLGQCGACGAKVPAAGAPPVASAVWRLPLSR